MLLVHFSKATPILRIVLARLLSLTVLLFPFEIYGQTSGTFTNTQQIVIPDAGVASQYPSQITVSGQSNYLTEIFVGFESVFHGGGFGDVDMLLEAPDGQKVLLCSDVLEGEGIFVNLAQLLFSSFSNKPLTLENLNNGIAEYYPTNEAPNPDEFPAPGPGLIGAGGLSLHALEGINPNGVWKLWVVSDDQNGFEGSLGYNNAFGDFGWKLIIISSDTKPCNRPDLPTVSQLEETQATVNWKSYGGQTAWDLYYGEAATVSNPDPATSPVMDNVSANNNFVINNLTPNKAYKLWVRGDCGNGSVSEWIGPLEFKTPFNPCVQAIPVSVCDYVDLTTLSYFTEWVPDDYNNNYPASARRILQLTAPLTAPYELKGYDWGYGVAYKEVGDCSTSGWTEIDYLASNGTVQLEAGKTYWFFVEEGGALQFIVCQWPQIGWGTQLSPNEIAPNSQKLRWAEPFNPGGVLGNWDIYYGAANLPEPNFLTPATEVDVQRDPAGYFYLNQPLPPAQSNKIYIRPRCVDLWGCWSNAITFVTPPSIVTGVNGFQADSIWSIPATTTSQGKFSWQAAPGSEQVDYWNVTWGPTPHLDPNAFPPANAGQGNAPTVVLGDFASSTDYDFWVRPVSFVTTPAYWRQDWFGPFTVSAPEPCISTGGSLECGKATEAYTVWSNVFSPASPCIATPYPNQGEGAAYYLAHQTGPLKIRPQGADGPQGALIAVYYKKFEAGCGISGWTHIGCWEMGQIQPSLTMPVEEGQAYYLMFDTYSDDVIHFGFELQQCEPACEDPADFKVIHTDANAITLSWPDDGTGSVYNLDYYLAYQGNFFDEQNPKVQNHVGGEIIIDGLLQDTLYNLFLQKVCTNGFKTYPRQLSKIRTGSDHPALVVFGNHNGCNPSTLRPFGTPGRRYRYESMPFTVPVSGAYTIEYLANNSLMVVYENEFSEDEVMQNMVAFSEENVPEFTLNLNAGQQYWLVFFEREVLFSSHGNICYFKGPGYASLGEPVYKGRILKPHGKIWEAGTSQLISFYTCADTLGWYHYYAIDSNSGGFDDADNHYLLFSAEAFPSPHYPDLQSALGESGEGGVVQITNPPAPYVTNPSGWYVMNRYWYLPLLPFYQPYDPIKVRYYYTDTDFEALQQAVAATGNPPPTEHEQLFFYKINDFYRYSQPFSDYDPNPMNGHVGVPQAVAYDADGYWEYYHGPEATAATWHHSLYKNGHAAEMLIRHFSGGGGGIGADLKGAFGLTAVPIVEKLNINVYPNPTSSSLNIAGLEDIGKATVRVYNLMGIKQLEQGFTSGASIDMSSLATGTYLLEIETELGRAIWKVVKTLN